MLNIITIEELKNTALISEKCNNSNEPIFITKNGYGDMVIMNMKLYEETMGQVYVAKLIKESLDDDGPSIPFNQAMQELKEKYV